MIDDVDILDFDTQEAYNAMYKDIWRGRGVKPKELYYLHWLMEKLSDKHGYGKSLRTVFIGKELM